MVRLTVMLAAVALLACAAGALVARADEPSPACQAATKRVASDQLLIKRLEAQVENTTGSAPVVNPARKRQIQTQLARLRADLATAQAEKAKACAKTPKSWTLADYDGVYQGGFTGTSFVLTFTVRAGVVTGDVASVAPLDPGTGNATVRASFAGASCAPTTLHIDPATGAAQSGTVTCSLSGLSKTGAISAKRAGK